MSSGADRCRSERVDRITSDGFAKLRLQTILIDNIDVQLEQLGDVPLDPGVIENCDPCGGIEFDEDVAACRTPRVRIELSERRNVSSTSCAFIAGI